MQWNAIIMILSNVYFLQCIAEIKYIIFKTEWSPLWLPHYDKLSKSCFQILMKKMSSRSITYTERICKIHLIIEFIYSVQIRKTAPLIKLCRSEIVKFHYITISRFPRGCSHIEFNSWNNLIQIMHNIINLLKYIDVINTNYINLVFELHCMQAVTIRWSVYNTLRAI